MEYMRPINMNIYALNIFCVYISPYMGSLFKHKASLSPLCCFISEDRSILNRPLQSSNRMQATYHLSSQVKFMATRELPYSRLLHLKGDCTVPQDYVREFLQVTLFLLQHSFHASKPVGLL